MNKYVDVWNSLHKDFSVNNKPKYDDWLDNYLDIINSIDSEIIDLGCGVTGNNTLYLLEKGKKVVSCDFADEALNVVKKIKGSKTLKFDMLDNFPFNDDYTDLIIADLSLHYFNDFDTKKIISEIKRVLRKDGYLFVRVNSTNSSEYKMLVDSSKELEHHLYFNNGMEKRFFDDLDIKKYFAEFKCIYSCECNMNRWCNDKIVWTLIFRNNK